MKNTIITLALLVATGAFAQTKPAVPVKPVAEPPAKYTPTPAEQDKLDSAAKDLQIIQLQYQLIQQQEKAQQDNYAAAQRRLLATEEEVKKAHPDWKGDTDEHYSLTDRVFESAGQVSRK